MCGAAEGAILVLSALADCGDPGQSGQPPTQRTRQEPGMEHTDWLDDGLNPAEACFLMLTAITHHHFSSPIWGEHEVRKLHAELVELDWLATQAAASHRR